MDFNDAYYGRSGLLYTDLPLGFGMSLTMNEAALNGYAALTEAENVDSLVPGADVQEIMEEEKEALS